MATPAIVTSGNQGMTGNFTLTIPANTDVRAGDRIVIGHMNDFYLVTNFNTPTCPTTGAWTGIGEISSNPGQTAAMTGKLWYADVVTTGQQDIAISTVTGDGSYLQYIVLRNVGGVDGSPAVNSSNAAVSPHVANAVSPITADALLLVFMVAGNNGVINYTAPSGMAAFPESDNPPYSTVALFSESLVAAGSTGSRIATPSATRRYAAITVAFSGAAASTTPVTSDMDVRWRVLNRVVSDLDVSWRVRTRVTSDVDLRWRVRAAVTSDLAVTWRVRAVVSSDLAVTWRVEGNEPPVTPDAVAHLVEFGSAVALLTFQMVEVDLGDEL